MVLVCNENQDSLLMKAAAKRAFPWMPFPVLWILAQCHSHVMNLRGFHSYLWQHVCPRNLGSLHVGAFKNHPVSLFYPRGERLGPYVRILIFYTFLSRATLPRHTGPYVFRQHLLFVFSHTWRFGAMRSSVCPACGIMEKGIREPALKIWLETNWEMTNRKIKSQKK